MAAGGDSNALRVVLLGKTGAGKSSTGNTLLDREAFRVARGLSSGTEKCQWADTDVDGLVLQVTDTPGLSDTHRSEDEVLTEVGKSIAVASPGPHIILMVIRCDSRFTPDDYRIYCVLRELFGPDIKQHMILLFVGTDGYGATREEQKAGLLEEMDSPVETLREVLKDAGNRFFGISNKTSKEERRGKAAELIDRMKELKRLNGGKYFQHSLSDTVTDLMTPCVDSRMAKGNKSRAEAVRETKLAIVDGTESEGFFKKLGHVMKKYALPLIKKGLKLAVDALASVAVEAARDKMGAKQCSVM